MTSHPDGPASPTNSGRSRDAARHPAETRPASGAPEWDVAVVGLGPVGTALAGLLGVRGLRVLGIEREAGLYPLPRAGHLDHTALRTFAEIGCLSAVLPGLIPNEGLELLSAGGEVLARLPVHGRTPSGLAASSHCHQPFVDRALQEAVRVMPTTCLRTRAELLRIEDDDEGVTLVIGEVDREREERARFVVGCDGASSRVRGLAGLPWIDYGFDEQWLIVDLILRERPAHLPRNTTFGADASRPYGAFELPGMRYRFEFMLLPGESPAEIVDRERALQLISPWLLPEHVEDIERTVVYTFKAGRVADWRNGRILVAGDAAHLTPPFLGQGLCSGFRDAANLAWKIEHVLHHAAPLALLDTYGQERAPHVDNVIHTSTQLGAVVCEIDPVAAKARDVDLRQSHLPPDRRLTFKLGELEQGPLVLPGGGRFMISPEVDGTPLDEIVGPRFLVLAREAGDLETPASEWWRDLGAYLTTLDDLPDAEQALGAWMDRHTARIAVVRPDRYVLGTGDRLDRITTQVAGLLAASSHC